LGGFLAADFSGDIKTLTNPLVNASVEAYNRYSRCLENRTVSSLVEHLRYYAGNLRLCAAPSAEKASGSTCIHRIIVLFGSCEYVEHTCKPAFGLCRTCQELLPTPAKSHYTFNLRDLSKVFQGLVMATTTTCATRESLARLWLHEMSRVFHDRLISLEDRDYFKHMLVSWLCSIETLHWKMSLHRNTF
jgi:hypothetical protein